MRRELATLGCALMVLTAVGRPRADDGSGEISVYEGQTAGAWSCGPRGDVRYGGAAAQVRYSEHAPNQKRGAGATVVGGSAVEVAQVKVRPSEDGLGLEHTNARGFAALNGRFGYHWRWFGAELGAAAFNGWSSESQVGWGGIPQLELTIGPQNLFYCALGFGVPTLTWATRPAIPYAGLIYGDPSHLRIQAYIGMFRSGPSLYDTQSPMVDIAWYVPFRPNVDLRANLAIGGDLDVDRQAGLGLAFGY